MVRYNSTKEVPVVAIFSNLNTFIYRITAPQRYNMYTMIVYWHPLCLQTSAALSTDTSILPLIYTMYIHVQWWKKTYTLCDLRIGVHSLLLYYSSQPDKWLSLKHTLPLSKLVYLDVGPFHQFLRLEYSIPGACLTFLLRDKKKCRECLTRLSCNDNKHCIIIIACIVSILLWIHTCK